MKQNIITAVSIVLICAVFLIMIMIDSERSENPCLSFVTEEGGEPKIWTDYYIYRDKKMRVSIFEEGFLYNDGVELFVLSDEEFDGIMLLADRINIETQKNEFIKDEALNNEIKAVLGKYLTPPFV